MKILLDSDYLFALYIEKDLLHKKASSLHAKHKENEFLILNITKQECATVFSKKASHKHALELLARLEGLDVAEIVLDSGLEEEAWRIFKNQTKKGTSFVDCANLAALKEYNLDKIASFDKFYLGKDLLK